MWRKNGQGLRTLNVGLRKSKGRVKFQALPSKGRVGPLTEMERSLERCRWFCYLKVYKQSKPTQAYLVKRGTLLEFFWSFS